MGTMIAVPQELSIGEGPQVLSELTATPLTDYESVVFHYRRNRSDDIDAHVTVLGDPTAITPMEHALRGYVARCAQRMGIIDRATITVQRLVDDDRRYSWAPRYRLSLTAPGRQRSVTLLWDRKCSTIGTRRDSGDAYVLFGELPAGLLEDQLLTVRAITQALMALCSS